MCLILQNPLIMATKHAQENESINSQLLLLPPLKAAITRIVNTLYDVIKHTYF